MKPRKEAAQNAPRPAGTSRAGRGPFARGLYLLTYLLRLLLLLYRSFTTLYWERGRGRALLVRVTLQQVYFTAFQALPLLLFVALAAGAPIMTYISRELPSLGFRENEYLATGVLLDGMAPLLVALVVIARSANAIVIEIGNMKVNGEIRSLQILGMNLDRFLVLPRILGMVLSVATLTMAFCAAALFGGYWVADTFLGLESNFVFRRLVASFDLDTFANVLLRALLFGLAIGAVSCYHGLQVGVSPTEVPQQASKGVVSCLSLCFLLNFLVAFFVEFQ